MSILTDFTTTSERLKALVFDLDGTLLDSFAAHYEAYERMFARFGITMSRKKFLATYSPNWYRTYEAFGLPKEEWEEADAYWMEEAAKQTPELLPGARDTLGKLHGAYRLGLVTSGSKGRVVKDIERTGIHHLFQSIVTGDDVREPKPAPEGLLRAMSELGVRPDEVVYVGDAQADYEMAQSARVAFIGTKSSFANPEQQRSPHPLIAIGELPALMGL